MAGQWIKMDYQKTKAGKGKRNKTTGDKEKKQIIYKGDLNAIVSSYINGKWSTYQLKVSDC